jgi:replication-associated recombination protein RarA
MDLGKKHHLWLYGPPSSGKTAIKLFKEANGIKMSNGINNGWWNEDLL